MEVAEILKRARELVMAGESRAALALLRSHGLVEQMAELALRLGQAPPTGPAPAAVEVAPQTPRTPAPSAPRGDAFQEARERMSTGEHRAAIALLDRVGTASPDYGRALVLRAEASLALGDAATARWAIEAALRVPLSAAEKAAVLVRSARMSLDLGDTGTAAARLVEIDGSGALPEALRAEVEDMRGQIGDGPYFRPRVLPVPEAPVPPRFPPARPRTEEPADEITGSLSGQPVQLRRPARAPESTPPERDEFAELLRSLGGEVILPSPGEPSTALDDDGLAATEPGEPAIRRAAAFVSWPSDNEPIEIEMPPEISHSGSGSDLSDSFPFVAPEEGAAGEEGGTAPEFMPQHERYEFIRRIGAGGMGIVLLARDVLEQREVVVKLLQNTKLPSETAKDLFLREAMVVAYLSHPNIVAVHDFGHMGEHPYIAMEYVEGVDLRKRAREAPGQRLPVAEVLPLFVQVASALDYAHGQGIVHRDIKLSNVIVGRDGVAKLLDFGIAQAVDNAGRGGDGRLMGTPLYMAPELIRREDFDHRVDIYAFGVALYRVLTGSYPFQGRKVLEYHLRKQPQDPLLIDPELPMELGSVVLRCLEKSAHARYETAGELGKALAAIR